MTAKKFRAWSKVERRFLSQEEMNETGGFYYDHGVDPDPDDYDLQQFVWLFDRDGKELFEGDIVEYNSAIDGERHKTTIPNLSNFHWFGNLSGKEDFLLISNNYEDQSIDKIFEIINREFAKTDWVVLQKIEFSRTEGREKFFCLASSRFLESGGENKFIFKLLCSERDSWSEQIASNLEKFSKLIN